MLFSAESQFWWCMQSGRQKCVGPGTVLATSSSDAREASYTSRCSEVTTAGSSRPEWLASAYASIEWCGAWGRRRCQWQSGCVGAA